MSLLYIFLIKIALSKMLSCCALKDLHRSYREAQLDMDLGVFLRAVN